MRPEPGEFPPYFERYLALVYEHDVLGLLNAQASSVHAALSGLSTARAAARYAEGKWTVREVLGHMVDAERVFGYRALAIARGETYALPSFDENAYAERSAHDLAAIDELAEEFATLRRSHVLMFKHLDDGSRQRIGRVGDHPMSPRALACIMAGHVRHHARIFSERYGIAVRA